MIIFSRNEGFHILVLDTYANNISFLSKGQQVVAQLEDRICPQAMDDFQIIVQKLSLPTIKRIFPPQTQ